MQTKRLQSVAKRRGEITLPAFVTARWTPGHFAPTVCSVYLWSFAFWKVFFFSVDGAISIWLGEGAHIARAWKGQCHSLNAYHANSPTVTGFHPAVTGLLGACIHVLFVSCSSLWPQSRVIYLGSARAKGERLSDYGG